MCSIRVFPIILALSFFSCGCSKSGDPDAKNDGSTKLKMPDAKLDAVPTVGWHLGVDFRSRSEGEERVLLFKLNKALLKTATPVPAQYQDAPSDKKSVTSETAYDLVRLNGPVTVNIIMADGKKHNYERNWGNEWKKGEEKEIRVRDYKVSDVSKIQLYGQIASGIKLPGDKEMRHQRFDLSFTP